MPQSRKQTPGIHLLTDAGPEVEILLVDHAGVERSLGKRTPTENLILVMDRDYAEYRKSVKALWDEHPLFEERQEVSVADFEDFGAQARLLPDMLKDADPAAFFMVGMRLDAALRAEDDGTAMFLLNAGAAMLRILWGPIHAQIRLRNIFEIAFDDYERGTQRERFAALERVWPGLVDRPFLCRKVPAREGDAPFGSRMDYTLSGLFELYLLDLSLHFGQERQRIARCEHCWNYFIPKTKQQTLYCDREFDGVSCKKAGANLKRRLVPEQDEALAIYNRLRERMAERLDRYETAADGDRDRLIPMDAQRYGEWLDMARQARREYLEEKISAVEFIRTIHVYDELELPTAEKEERVSPSETLWRRRVEANINFDPEASYPPMLHLDLGEGPNAQWQYLSSKELQKRDRAGHESLREKYGKEK